jgi:hypothetical protein
MKNEKNVKDKKRTPAAVILACLLLCGVMVLLTPGCGGAIGNRLEVTVELPDPHSVSFENYDNVLYKDLVLESIPKGYDPVDEINTFFIEDLSRIVDKKIVHWNREEHGEMVPKSLLIVTGSLKLDIKSRSKIKDIKEKGKEKKAFVTVQHWEMILTVVMKDAAAGKEIFKDEFKAKLANAEAGNAKFNFENLFYKVTSRFVKKVTRTKKMQRRHLLI